MGRLKLRLQILMADLFQWLALICLAFLEFVKEPRPLKISIPALTTEDPKTKAS